MKNKITPDSLEWIRGNVKGFFGKELINIDNGSSKLLKILPFSKYPIHLHPDKIETAHVIEGNPEFTIGEVQYPSVPSDFFIFPINTKHAIENNTNEECLLLIGAIKQGLETIRL